MLGRHGYDVDLETDKAGDLDLIGQTGVGLDLRDRQDMTGNLVLEEKRLGTLNL